MNENEKYGALIRAAREAKGWDQDRLGREIGRDKSFVSRWELGRPTTPPEPWLVRAMWRVLGLSMRTQLEELGYLDPEAAEPGIAHAVEKGTSRAQLLDVLAGATDAEVEVVTRHAELAIGLAQKAYGTRRDRPAPSVEDRSTNRTA